MYLNFIIIYVKTVWLSVVPFNGKCFLQNDELSTEVALLLLIYYQRYVFYNNNILALADKLSFRYVLTSNTM